MIKLSDYIVSGGGAQTLTVTITLAEYRQLITDAARFSFLVDELDKKINALITAVEGLREEADDDD